MKKKEEATIFLQLSLLYMNKIIYKHICNYIYK